MSRIKYVLQAPANICESIIDGTPYWPDEDGLIETTNPTHLGPLKLHGYKISKEIALVAPPRARTHSAIDADDLGRTGLIEALDARGVSYPDNASRADLADIAMAWNKARAAPSHKTAAPPQEAAPRAAPPRPAPVAHEPAPEPARAAAAPAPAHATAAGPIDFSTFGYEELKGWLASRGVEFAGNAAKKVLIGLATDYHAKHSGAAQAERVLETEAV